MVSIIRNIKRLFRIFISWFLAYGILSLIGAALCISERGLFIHGLFWVVKIVLPLAVAFVALSMQFYNEAVEDGELEEILSTTSPLFRRSTTSTAQGTKSIVSNLQSCEPEEPEYMDAEFTVDEILTKVAGTSFNNSDGSSRQKILSRCRSGDRIELKYYRYKGEPAYAVHTHWGRIGNLPAEDARALYNMPKNYCVSGVITKVTGGRLGKYYGCNIQLTIYETRKIRIYT